MQIGIIGLGIVGSACKFGFEKLGHDVSVHDIKLDTDIKDVLKTEIIYICVPTPMNEDWTCDTSIVESIVYDLIKYEYQGIIAVKSTVPPGTTNSLLLKYFSYTNKIIFVPEFLRERCAISDFVENQKLLVVGTDYKEYFDKVVECHGSYPKQVMHTSLTEAELIKYYNNCFGALRVVFANEFYEIAKAFGVNYNKVKSGLLATSEVPDIYLDVNDNMRGYSSICWNKDVPALIALSRQLDLDLPLLSTLPLANDKYEKTPFKGTRE